MSDGLAEIAMGFVTGAAGTILILTIAGGIRPRVEPVRGFAQVVVVDSYQEELADELGELTDGELIRLIRIGRTAQQGTETAAAYRAALEIAVGRGVGHRGWSFSDRPEGPFSPDVWSYEDVRDEGVLEAKARKWDRVYIREVVALFDGSTWPMGKPEEIIP